MFPHDDDLQPFGPPDVDSPILDPEVSAPSAPPGAWTASGDGAPGDGPQLDDGQPEDDWTTPDMLTDERRVADVLEPEPDGRNEPVRIDRKFVMAGVLIAGTVLCLLLVVFGGSDSAAPAAQAAPASPPPGAYVDEAAAGYYDETALDPAAPVDPAYPDPYGSNPYGAQAYGSYGGGGSAAPAHGYATTQPYGATGSGQGTGGRSASGAPARAPDPAREAYERAVASPLMAGSSASGTQRPDPPADLGPEAAEELAFMREVAGMFSSNGPPPPTERVPAAVTHPTALTSQSPGAPPQGRTQATASAGRGTEYEVVARPASGRPTLRAGSVIPAALVTGMNSDLPGPVVAQVTRNVYDSATQRDVLIPAGTRLVGEYDDQIATGQNRALVAWTQMTFPDGTTVELPGLPGADLEGNAGLSDRVDRHYGRVVGSALLLAAVGAGVEMAAPSNRGIGFDVSPQEVASRQVAIELSRIATETVRQDLRVQPTVRVSPGYRFYVLLARDLPFASPYRARAAVGRFARGASSRR